MGTYVYMFYIRSYVWFSSFEGERERENVRNINIICSLEVYVCVCVCACVMNSHQAALSTHRRESRE